jgi:hypothetical protein
VRIRLQLSKTPLISHTKDSSQAGLNTRPLSVGTLSRQATAPSERCAHSLMEFRRSATSTTPCPRSSLGATTSERCIVTTRLRSVKTSKKLVSFAFHKLLGICKFASSCCFAHGDDQLRTLTDPMPVLPPNVLLYNPPNLRRHET